NGKGYIVSGYNTSTSAYSNEVWEYNPIDDSWTQKSNFPGLARREGSGFTIGNAVYYGLGRMSNTAYDDFWEYNAMSDTWTQKSNFAGGILASAASFVIGSDGYVVCGSALGNTYNKLWKYDSSNDTWTLKDNFPSSPMSGGIAFEIANKGYFGIGNVSNTAQRAFWEYDPEASLSYAWSTGAVTADITVYSAGTYSLTLTNGAGCTATATQEVIVNSAPAVFVNSQSMCYGGSATISASGAATYSWNSGQTTASITVSPNVTTNYTVTGVDTNGCANSEVATVTVHPYNDVAISLTGSTLSVAQTGVNYQWHQCVTTPPPAGLNPVNGETNQDFSPAANGDYAVVVTNSFGCMDTSACTTVLSVGIAEASDISEIEIYPNPFAEKFTIKCNAAITKITVANAIGQQIQTIESSVKGDEHEVNLETLPAGMYFINVSLDYENKVYKVIKE
ncbi:MAG TPA: T9SS type A sorting domain-containing protein, partial [Bacteroidia bacterium]